MHWPSKSLKRYFTVLSYSEMSFFSIAALIMTKLSSSCFRNVRGRFVISSKDSAHSLWSHLKICCALKAGCFISLIRALSSTKSRALMSFLPFSSVKLAKFRPSFPTPMQKEGLSAPAFSSGFMLFLLSFKPLSSIFIPSQSPVISAGMRL